MVAQLGNSEPRSEPPFAYLGEIAHGLRSSVRGALIKGDEKPVAAPPVNEEDRAFDPWYDCLLSLRESDDEGDDHPIHLVCAGLASMSIQKDQDSLSDTSGASSHGPESESVAVGLGDAGGLDVENPKRAHSESDRNECGGKSPYRDSPQGLCEAVPENRHVGSDPVQGLLHLCERPQLVVLLTETRFPPRRKIARV